MRMTSLDAEKTKRRYRKRSEQLKSLVNKPCHDCGMSFPWWIMEFDHVPERGPKIETISSMGRWLSHASQKFQDELKKCDIVCANCHKTRTHARACQDTSCLCKIPCIPMNEVMHVSNQVDNSE